MKSIKSLFLIGVLLSCSTIYCQEITWGDRVANLPYGIFDLVQLKDSNFFTVTQKSGFADKKRLLHYYENFVLKSESQLKLKYNDTSYHYFDSKVVNEKFYVFSNNLSYYHGRLLVQEYNENCLPSGVPKELMNLKESNATRYEFFIKESENKEFIVVLSKVYAAHKNNPNLVYRVFTKNFDLVHEGIYTLPKKDRWGFYSNELLTNTGDLFFVVEQDSSTTQGKLFSFFRANKNGLKECPVRMSYDFVSQLGLAETENHQLLCTGLFGLQPKSVDGIFSCEIDFDLSDKKNEGSVSLNEDYLFDKTSKQLVAYNFLEVVKTDQGFFVLVEQITGATGGVSYTAPSETIASSANVSSNSTQLSMGTVTNVPSVGYWNYLIIYKIGNDGLIDWINKIEKNQIGGFDSRYTSCVGHLNGDSYTLYFNDNAKNYHSEGFFTGNMKKNSVYETRIGSDEKDAKDFTLAKVEIDLSSGKYKRTSFISGEQIGMTAGPKSFIFNSSKEEYLIYFQAGSEARFGILKI